MTKSEHEAGPINVTWQVIKSNNAPIALPHFVQACSMKNLEQIVARSLGRDYQRTGRLALEEQNDDKI